MHLESEAAALPINCNNDCHDWKRELLQNAAMVEIDYDLRYCIFDENFRENNMVISKGERAR